RSRRGRSAARWQELALWTRLGLQEANGDVHAWRVATDQALRAGAAGVAARRSEGLRIERPERPALEVLQAARPVRVEQVALVEERGEDAVRGLEAHGEAS